MTTLMTDKVTESVFAILMQNAKKAPEEITEDTNLESIGLDSLDLVECVFDLEEKFDITIPNPGEKAEIDTTFKTAGEVVVAVRKLISQSALA